MSEATEEILLKKENESVDDYVHRIAELKKEIGLRWDDIAKYANEQYGFTHEESYYRKRNKNYGMLSEPVVSDAIEEQISHDEETLRKIRLEKLKLSDERTQNNAYLRRLSREETIKEIAKYYADSMGGKLLLREFDGDFKCKNGHSAILTISDWHYGIEVNNYWNTYNPEICKERVTKLKDEVIKKCKENNIHDLYVVNLSDLICGRIHLKLRLQSRIDVITQVMQVAEILAEFLNELNGYFDVHYYDCLDNHSRLEPKKEDALELETLTRIIPWYLINRIGDRIDINVNPISDDIITFKIGNFNILGVHGDKDTVHNVVQRMTLMTGEKYDLILIAHFHHFSCDEESGTVIIANGSLMGTDDYAKDLRKYSKPSQNLIIVKDDNVCESINRIILE